MIFPSFSHVGQMWDKRGVPVVPPVPLSLRESEWDSGTKTPWATRPACRPGWDKVFHVQALHQHYGSYGAAGRAVGINGLKRYADGREVPWSASAAKLRAAVREIKTNGA